MNQISRRTFVGLSGALAAANACHFTETATLAQSAAKRRSADSVAKGVPFVVGTADGLNVSAMEYGVRGNPGLVLIHGLGQSRLSWSRQLIPGVVDRYHVVTYDLRGHGDSDKPTDPSAYANGAKWAEELRAVIETAKLVRPVLVGWSLGGQVIGHYLAKYGAEQIAAINLVNAVTRLATELLSPLALQFAGRLASPDLAERTFAIEGFLESCFATAPSEDDLRRMLVYNGMVPLAVQRGVVQLSSDGLEQAFSSIPHLLVTYGEKDKLTKPEMSRRMLNVNSKAKLSLYPRSGHSPFYEEPERFNRELLQLLAEVSV